MVLVRQKSQTTITVLHCVQFIYTLKTCTASQTLSAGRRHCWNNLHLFVRMIVNVTYLGHDSPARHTMWSLGQPHVELIVELST